MRSRMLCGLLTPTEGEISVLGHEIPRDAEALKRKVGYMTQKFSLFEDLTVSENLDFMANIYTMPRALRKTRVPEAVERYELGRLLRQRAGTLSGGQKQRLALAAATLHQPELIDEFLAAKRGGIFLISHLGNFEICRCLSITRPGTRLRRSSPSERRKGSRRPRSFPQARTTRSVSLPSASACRGT